MDLIKQAAEELGNVVADKNIMYGNSWAKAADMLSILYPDGVPTHAYIDALLIVRTCDKLCRIAQGHPDTENPWQDVSGYGLLGSLKREQL